MAVVVFDTDVLIGFLNGRDAHHVDAVARVRESLAPGMRRMLCAVNYSELLIGPIKAGKAARDHIDQRVTTSTTWLATLEFPRFRGHSLVT